MSINKIIWLAFMYITATIVCLTLNGQVIGGDFIDQINALSSLQIVTTEETSVFTSLINNAANYLSGLFNMLTFNYSFFDGGWVILRYVLMAIPIGIVFGLIQFKWSKK